MLKNQLYNYLHQYLAEYLFGFDKSQLEVAILSGQIDLKDVNVRPDKVNDILKAMRAPFALKAGMIGKLCLQYNLLSFLSDPFSVSIEDVQIILGPNTSLMSDQDSDEEPLEAPYDPNNCYNIFTHKIKFTLDPKSKKARLKGRYAEDQEDSTMSTYVRNILKNVKLLLNHVHIRYEDDFFAPSPFAFGFLCDQITSYGSETEWNFGSLENNQFRRIPPKDSEGLIIRESNIINLRLYWKSSAEMFIPNSLWESTKHLEKQIFDAISLEDMRSMMRQSFADDNLIEPFSVYTSFAYNTRPSAKAESLSGKRSKIKADILFTKISVNVKPNIVEDMGSFVEYVANLGIMTELKNYRPCQRPITAPVKGNEPSKLRKKRLLIVRDWFFYAIWATRIKKAIRAVYETHDHYEAKQKEIKMLYRTLMKRMEEIKTVRKWDNTNKEDVAAGISLLKRKMEKDDEYAEEEDAMAGIQLTFRWQNLSLGIHPKDSVVIKKPILEFQLLNPCLHTKFLKESIEAAVFIGELRAFDFTKGVLEKKPAIERNAPNDIVYRRGSFAKSPIPRPYIHHERLLTESKEMPLHEKNIRDLPTLKSLTTTHENGKLGITQRCFLLFQGKSGLQSHGLKLNFSLLQKANPASLKGKITLKVELGNTSTEMSYGLLNNIAEAIKPYREQYWFRDLFESSKKHKITQRGVIIENPGRRRGAHKDLPEEQVKKLKELAQICPVVGDLDELLEEKEFVVDLSCGDLSVSLVDENLGEPFTEIKLAPNAIRAEKVGGKCSINAFGVNLTTTKSFSFSSYFIKKVLPFIEENSVSDFLKEYQARYRRPTVTKKSKRNYSQDYTASKPVARATSSNKVADILKVNSHLPKLSKQLSEKCKETMMRRINVTAFEESKGCDNTTVSKKTIPEDHMQFSTMDSAWRNYIGREKGGENLELEEVADQPIIPLANGENKTNVRLSKLNERIIQSLAKPQKREITKKRLTTATKPHRGAKENNKALDLNESTEETAPKVNNVLRFPSFQMKKNIYRKFHK